MGTYDADLQAAVDATSVAKDVGETELLQTLTELLAERDIETKDQEWLDQTVAGIEADRNYLIESEPNDFTPRHDRRDDD